MKSRKNMQKGFIHFTFSILSIRLLCSRGSEEIFNVFEDMKDQQDTLDRTRIKDKNNPLHRAGKPPRPRRHPPHPSQCWRRSLCFTRPRGR